MSLGGYKFAGYYVSTPSGFDSTDPAQRKAQLLKMFRCRLKAFMESCAASGSQWEFYQADGDESFGEYGNVIYYLNDSQDSFGAFFKYSGKDAYYAIVSDNNNPSIGTHFSLYGGNPRDVSNDCSVISIVPITKDNVGTTISGKTDLMGSWVLGTSWYARSSYSFGYGFAVNGVDVIEILYTKPSTWYALVSSADAFSSLFGPTDTYGLLVIQFDFLNYRNGGNSKSPITDWIQVLKNTGIPYRGISNGAGVGIYANFCSFCASPQNGVPYGSAIISGNLNNPLTISEQCVNADGICGKGIVRAELLSVNTPQDATNYFPSKEVYANGNLLSVHSNYGGSYDTRFCSGTIYCGWDPSNPNIFQDGAWPEYTE